MQKLASVKIISPVTRSAHIAQIQERRLVASNNMIGVTEVTFGRKAADSYSFEM
jgi:hypothetical protein